MSGVVLPATLDTGAVDVPGVVNGTYLLGEIVDHSEILSDSRPVLLLPLF